MPGRRSYRFWKSSSAAAYHVKRTLPEPKERLEENVHHSDVEPDGDGWLEICAAADLEDEDVIRFDHGRKTFALYRDGSGRLFATDGVCTHGNTHLAEGLEIDVRLAGSEEDHLLELRLVILRRTLELH